MVRSRLKKSMERQTKQQIVMMIMGMLVIIGVVAFFGVPLFVKYSLFIEKMKEKQDTVAAESSDTFIQSPLLSQTFTATNSAQVTLSGTAQPKQTVKLYVNDELQDKATVLDDGSFSFSDVSLSSGDNTIKTKAVNDNKKESGFSNTLTISYQNKPPTLSIDSPLDNQIITGDNSKVIVSGKTDAGVKVTINGFWAIVDDNGNYQYNLSLQNGENKFTVVATDKAGNKTEQERKVIYNH